MAEFEKPRPKPKTKVTIILPNRKLVTTVYFLPQVGDIVTGRFGVAGRVVSVTHHFDALAKHSVTIDATGVVS